MENTLSENISLTFTRAHTLLLMTTKATGTEAYHWKWTLSKSNQSNLNWTAVSVWVVFFGTVNVKPRQIQQVTSKRNSLNHIVLSSPTPCNNCNHQSLFCTIQSRKLWWSLLENIHLYQKILCLLPPFSSAAAFLFRFWCEQMLIGD